MSADVPLKDKEAFYAQIELLDAPSDGDNELPQYDQEFRERCREYFNQAQIQARAKVNSRKSSQTARIDLTASYKDLNRTTTERPDTVPTPVSARSAVIELTPSALAQDKRANRRRVLVSTSFVEDTPRQNPRPSAVASLKRSTTNPPLIPSLSIPSSNQTTSLPNMAKRKREDLIPHDQRWLKGLRLFYIPGDRISLRRGRMEHAERYGAVVTRTLGDATHVIVDDRLAYEDIKDEEGMDTVFGKDKPVIVREHWPIDSIANKRLLPTNHAKYRVKGLPTRGNMAVPPPQEQAASQASKKSLKLKVPSNNPNKWNYVPQSTPSQSERSSAPNYDSGEAPRGIIMGPAPDQRVEATAGEDIVLTSQAPSGNGETRPSPKTRNHGTGPDHEDELSQLIGDVQKNFQDLTALGDDDDDDNNSEDQDGSDDDSQNGSEGERQAKRQKLPNNPKRNIEGHFACSRGGTKDKGSREGGPNVRVIAVLQQMLDYYTRVNDHWRMLMYRKAINTLSRQPVKITTAKQARELPYIGNRIASKIEEIVNTDRLQRLEYAQNDPKSQSLKLFHGIYGVGTSTADRWIAQGFRTLDDLRQKANLTPNQRIGLDHYDDLNSRIPRAEVEALGDYVKQMAARIDKDVELIIGGSYRRGADSSGDIDFIVTKKGTMSSGELNPFLDRLVASLTKDGFLTAELASHNSYGNKHHKDGNGSKWHGCCVLPRIPGSSTDSDKYRPVWRRIDLLLVPETEYGAALIYFTGNDIFNRSIRLLASKKKMKLNQRGLYKAVMSGPGRSKSSEGELLEGRSEKKIFEILGVQWREPHERMC
ncbi:hypothetical protein VSDG_07981 [Cytospora chrysosperma]|uniref:DNA polymerase lambda n=1 Tax=Cytospora chrysosperma TaxID=252740 RepID=A0A423VIJ3_CYTCH|nr:hypothetical protein VSDG_07981 [Valsa sordida]